MKYLQEVRNEVNDCFQEHLSVSSIVQTFKIPYQTVYKWKQEYLENLKPDELSYLQRILYLERRIDKLERELAVWKECRANKSSSIEEKVKEVQRLGPVYGIHAVCRILDLRRSNYYHHTLRSPEITQIKAEDERLKPIVASIFEETKHRIGPDKIRIIMAKRGYIASERRIRRLLKEMNLTCIDRGKTPHNTEPPKQKYYIKRLKQQFTVYEPNKVWVCDTTYLYINYETYYLTVIMDLFSRKVIAYKVVDCLSASPAIELFKTAFEERGCPTGLMFHCDQGGQFTAYRFRVLLRGKKVKQSFSSPGNPYDNAVIESFFRTLKTEQIYVNFDAVGGN